MTPEQLTILGYIAATITTGSFFPQVYKTYMTKSVADLSYWMLGLFLFGIVLWFIYGVELDAMPIILANGITGVMILALIIMKYTYSKPKYTQVSK